MEPVFYESLHPLTLFGIHYIIPAGKLLTLKNMEKVIEKHIKRSYLLKPMNYNSLYTKAYEQFHHSTPLKADCGTLCQRACCRGLEEDSGMWLFPGEEELLRQEPSFKIQPTGLKLKNDRPLQWLICSGECVRKFRPLACRLFPLTPYLTPKGILTTIIDPRSKSLCPLAGQPDQLQKEFIQTANRVCRQLAREPEILEFIEILTSQIEDYRELTGLFGREL
jgi:Fe-S-cluster containining protein